MTALAESRQSMKRSRFVLMALLCATTTLGGLSAPTRAWSQARAETYLYAFQDAEIVKVVQEVLDGVNAPYVIDPAVSGRMSFRIDQRLTRAQLIEALDAALALNGVALVRDKDRLLITPLTKARGASAVRPYEPGARRIGFQIVAVPLAFAQPSEVAKTLESIAGKDLLALPYDRLGLLVLGGGRQDLDSAIETIKVFDQNVFAQGKLAWYQLNQASAAVVAGELERLVQGSGAAGVGIVPLKRLNGVMVFARSSEVLDQIRRWIAQLDIGDSQGASALWVYHPRHTSAESLAKTLTAVLSGPGRGVDEAGSRQSSPVSSQAASTVDGTASVRSTNETGSGAPLDNSGRITVDKDSNTLFYTGAAGDWVKAQRVLAEIDKLPNQILVEASIVEVTLTRDFQFGVDWSALSGDFQIASINNKAGQVKPSYPGGSVTFLHGNIAAAVNALGSVANVQVVSAPKIVVLDNRTARLQIGDQVPTVSQSQQSTSTGGAPLINSIDYRSTGVILSVTPRISGSDTIALEVSQEVSSVAKTQTSGIDSPTIQQRRFESALLMQSGSTVALGGLINNNMSNAASGVPGLKSVPGLGALFRSDGRNQARTELIVLMSARILSDQPSANVAMSDLYQDMTELQRRGLLPKAP